LGLELKIICSTDGFCKNVFTPHLFLDVLKLKNIFQYAYQILNLLKWFLFAEKLV